MASGVTIPTAVNILPPTVGQAMPRSLAEHKQQLDIWTRKCQQIVSSLHGNVITLQQTGGGGGGGGYTHANFVADFAAETTDSLSEGVTNLYWSQALFNAAYAAAGGSGVTISVTSPLNLSSGVISIQQANATEAGYLSAADWITFYDGASGAAAALPQNKSVRSVMLCSAYTPFITGADVAEVTIPYNGDGTSETFTITRLVFRVGTAGGAPQIRVELSTVSGVFVPVTVGVVTLASGASEGSSTGGFTTSSCASGNKLRFNVLALGSASNFCIQVEILPT